MQLRPQQRVKVTLLAVGLAVGLAVVLAGVLEVLLALALETVTVAQETELVAALALAAVFRAPA